MLSFTRIYFLTHKCACPNACPLDPTTTIAESATGKLLIEALSMIACVAGGAFCGKEKSAPKTRPNDCFCPILLAA